MVVKRKSFATLIKLQKNRVDEQRQILSQLQDLLDQVDARIAELEIIKARELDAAQDMATRASYGAFLKAAVERGRILEKERHIAGLAVKSAQDKLIELYEDQKRYETAEAQRIEEEAQEERRIERIDLDEVGGIMHERRRGE